jgi:hypothetical protein
MGTDLFTALTKLPLRMESSFAGLNKTVRYQNVIVVTLDPDMEK